jgi:hypothetical protein
MAAIDLTTVANVRAWIPAPAGTPSAAVLAQQDAILQAAITAASLDFMRRTGRGPANWSAPTVTVPSGQTMPTAAPAGSPISTVSTLTLTASTNISGLTAVATSSGQAVTASSSTGAPVVGIATGGALAGADVTVQYEGPISDTSWSWAYNQPIFIAANGVLTQTAPTSGYSQIVGYPINATSLLIDIQAPITLN